MLNRIYLFALLLLPLPSSSSVIDVIGKEIYRKNDHNEIDHHRSLSSLIFDNDDCLRCICAVIVLLKTFEFLIFFEICFT